MAQAGDTSLTRELRFALDAYVDARLGWRQIVEVLRREREARGLTSERHPNDERDLYRYARGVVAANYVGDLPEGSMFEEFADRARRYMTEIDRLRVVLERLNRHLTTVSDEAEAGES